MKPSIFVLLLTFLTFLSDSGMKWPLYTILWTIIILVILSDIIHNYTVEEIREIVDEPGYQHWGSILFDSITGFLLFKHGWNLTGIGWVWVIISVIYNRFSLQKKLNGKFKKYTGEINGFFEVVDDDNESIRSKTNRD